MSLRAVFFDMGGTIETFRFTRKYRINNAHLIRECLLKVDIHLTLTDEELADKISRDIAAYHQWNLASMIELPTAEIWSRFIFNDLPIDTKKLEAISEELAFLYETFFYIRELRPEIPDVLKKIQQLGLKIGCISNTQSLTQVHYSLKKYQIEQYFDPIILSSAYGRRKPDPAIFYYAARQANLPTSACVYVGDKINRDILGAHRANYGLAVQIKHQFDDGAKDEGATPDAVITNMQELLPILKKAIHEEARKVPGGNGRRIKALFFDAGDILYYRPEKSPNLKNFLAGKKLNPVTNFDLERKRLRDLAFSGKLPRHEYYQLVLRLYGLEDSADIEAGVAAQRLDDDTVSIPEGVPETINMLKSMGFLLGIITDTAMPFSRKLNWFDEHGFGRVWDVVISSKELGVRKPDPSMYAEAINQTGIQADEAAFIGHKTSELVGAKAVGMKTIAFNYDDDASADYYIENFGDLLHLPLLTE